MIKNGVLVLNSTTVHWNIEEGTDTETEPKYLVTI